MSLRRLLLPRVLAIALLTLGGVATTAAQTPPPFPSAAPAAVPPSAPAPAATPAAPPAATPEDLQRLIGTLNDPAARAKLIAALGALLQAEQHGQPGAARAPTAAVTTPVTTPATAPPNPADWVDRVIGVISDGIDNLADEAAAAGHMARRGHYAIAWLEARVADPDARRATLDLIGRLVIVLVGAGGVEWLVRLLIARPRHSLEQWTARSAPGRWLLLLARVILALVPLCAFVATAYIILPLTTPDAVARLVVIAVINANVLVRAILAAARRVLVPEGGEAEATARPRRLIRVDDATARYAYRWIRRLSRVGIYGFFLISAAGLLGVPHSVRDLLLRALGLTFTIMLIVVILQNRAPIGRRIAGTGRREAGTSPGASDEWSLIRARFAEVWHVLAISYVVGAFLVWALAIPRGFAFLASATLWTAVTLVLLRAALVLTRRLGARAGRALTHDPAATPTRAQLYLPLAHAALRAILVLLGAAAILQAWGVGVWSWLLSPLGHRVLTSAFSIAVILAVAVAAWEVASIMITRSLALGRALDSPALRAARLRTLLPLLRNALSVVIVVLTALVILSELGIDIAPLLAGAGVVGLAIGFGAQTLVKDVITGLFFLLEDTVNVGDVVDVGSGHSGLVESMSIRSLRLRDLDGSVHTVPFSAVAAVKNQTKDLGYAVVDILVDYRSDLTRALAVLREVDGEIRADPTYGPLILAPSEIMGVERFADNAVVARCRIRTLPIRRWDVGREFNRRVKLAFDRAGIGMVAAVPPPTPEDGGQKTDDRSEEARAARH